MEKKVRLKRQNVFRNSIANPTGPVKFGRGRRGERETRSEIKVAEVWKNDGSSVKFTGYI